MGEVKRWYWNRSVGMCEGREGNFILYTDHAEAMREKDAEVAKLRQAMRDLSAALDNGEWADLLSLDPDISDLESKIYRLVDDVFVERGEKVTAEGEIKRYRQAIWDARAIMGFDNDGDPTPVALTFPHMADMLVREATEFRADYDEANRECERAEAQRDALLEDAERYRFIRDNPRCSLQISHNDHHNSYLSVADTLDGSQEYYDEVDAYERQRMIESDSIWSFHEYPRTPVGFNVWHASTLDRAIDAAIASAEKGEV